MRIAEEVITEKTLMDHFDLKCVEMERIRKTGISFVELSNGGLPADKVRTRRVYFKSDIIEWMKKRKISESDEG